MNQLDQKDLSRAEWKVMKIVWDLGRGMAREVYTVAGKEHGWTPTTVKTILKRLVDKKYLRTTQVGNGFVYRPTRAAIFILKTAADTLLKNAAEGTTGPLLAHMVERSSLTEEELRSLQQLIDDKKQMLKRRDDDESELGGH